MKYLLFALAVVCAAGAWLIGQPALQHYRVAHWVISPTDGHPGMERLVGRPIQHLSDTDFERRTGEDDRALMARLNKLVHDSTWHCYPTDYELSPIERRVHEVMGSPRIFHDGILVRERFTCGFCHQRASLLAEALVANGIKAIVLGINGHVVVHVTLPDEMFYLDPDYGVGPLNGSAESILNAYSLLPYGDPESILAMYQSEEDNGLYASSRLADEVNAQRRLFKEADRVAFDKALAGLSLLTLAVVLVALGNQLRGPRQTLRLAGIELSAARNS